MTAFLIVSFLSYFILSVFSLYCRYFYQVIYVVFVYETSIEQADWSGLSRYAKIHVRLGRVY